jgi:DNA-binding response OmpR family regulator
MRRSLLLLEDDRNLGMILQEHLELNGFSVRLCTNGEDGLKAYRKGAFDLCLVDVMMPRKDGFTFARELRQHDTGLPLIFLTARAMKEDRIEGLKIGADDYVTKPFSMEELLLRIGAVLKRSGRPGQADPQPESFAIGSFTFHYPRRSLERQGKARKLTTREADLLRLLCMHFNGTLDRATALRDLWGDDTHYASRSMDVFVSRLRKYLKGDPTVEILNVHGQGVKLVVSPAPTRERAG